MKFNFSQIQFDDPLFAEVLALRALAYGRSVAGEADVIDTYSNHFVALSEGEVVGSLRVTYRSSGPLESERYYPNWLTEEFGSWMGAGSRMCIAPELKASTSIPMELTKMAWSVALPQGVRIDVSKARLEAIPFYMKMGYYYVRDTIFAYEKWNALCGLIALPANPSIKGKVGGMFEGIRDPIDIRQSSNSEMFIASYREFCKSSNTRESATT